MTVAMETIRSLRAVTPQNTIIEARHISQRFTADNDTELTVLHDISFNLYEGEIVAILGRSGAGKSTFLRALAGLVKPTSGTVKYRGETLTGPNPGIALVFQTFALMPWLTVQDNVELGLKARGVPRAERAKLALEAIDMIGLDGFESAYPKELSGGMRQRVGIARALVLRPDALFMDEPFSALDVLTAENLRQEVLKLWSSEQRSIKSVLMVTHNIEEAAEMADRVVVLGSHPGHLIANVRVDLPRPRDRHSAEFEAMVDKLYSILTSGQTGAELESAAVTQGAAAATPIDGQHIGQPEGRGGDAGAGVGTVGGSLADHEQHGEPSADNASHPSPAQAGMGAAPGTVSQVPAGKVLDDDSDMTSSIRVEHPLPNATPGGLAGLLDVVAEHPDGIDLADLASDLSFEVDDLFPLVDAGTLLHVIVVRDGHVQTTEAGDAWHKADILRAKQVFASLAMEHVPLVRNIEHALRRSAGGKLRGELMLDLLHARYPDVEAHQQFATAVEWGRYGELFDYDADDDLLTLDEANKGDRANRRYREPSNTATGNTANQ